MLALCSVGLVRVAAAEPAQPSPDCASVVASARMQAYGYLHLVTLVNRCKRAVSCEVWTNVDPLPHFTLQAKPGQSAEVATRYSSPSSVVQAGKQCRFASD